MTPQISILQAIVYGLIQGVAGFLPISSVAHVRILPALVHWPDPGAAYSAVIQLGTVVAIIVYFAKDLSAAFIGWFNSLRGRGKDSHEAKVGWAIFWSTIPIVILGGLLHHLIETKFRNLYIIATSLIVLAVVMFIADRYRKHEKTIEDVTPIDGWKLGLWQCLALIPGMSRSGSTIAGALFDGYDRASAARFAFLMSVPALTAAGLYEGIRKGKHFSGSLLVPSIVGFLAAFLSGYAVISWFIRFLQRKGIAPFVWYRIALGCLLLALLANGMLKPMAGDATAVPGNHTTSTH